MKLRNNSISRFFDGSKISTLLTFLGNFLLQQQQKSKETFPTLSEMVPKFHSTPKPVNPTPSAFTPGPSNG